MGLVRVFVIVGHDFIRIRFLMTEHQFFSFFFFMHQLIDLLSDHLLPLSHHVFIAVFASFTRTKSGTRNSTLIAFTVFLETPTFLTVAPFSMKTLFLDLRLESVRVAFYYGIHCHLFLFVIFFIGAILAVTLWRAT